MQFDPIKFGEAMGELVKSAVQPLLARIEALESDNLDLRKQAAEHASIKADHEKLAAGVNVVSGALEAFGKRLDNLPVPANGNDADPAVIKQMVAEAVAAIPRIEGENGTSVTLDDVLPHIKSAIDEQVARIPAPKDGADGVGVAGAMIDRNGDLLLTLSNGEVKSLGRVEGKDGIGWDSFDMEVIPETGEFCVKVSCSGRVKEVRAPILGMRPAGYWSDGKTAKPGECYSHDGSGWLAIKETRSRPAYGGDWQCIARKGRDGETVVKMDKDLDAPVKLGDK